MEAKKIDITKVDLIEFAQEVYKLSSPQGLGILHFTPEPLAREEAIEIVNAPKDDKRIALDMDYVKGRACKMNVFKEGDKLFIYSPWYDHPDSSLKELLEHFNIKIENINEQHAPACNCWNCRLSRETMANS